MHRNIRELRRRIYPRRYGISYPVQSYLLQSKVSNIEQSLYNTGTMVNSNQIATVNQTSVSNATY